eukprot:TRINITY_DN15739_c0_g1_i1.p1 TRINITY_DN15739_c0_g1~~TRINITY_DN15739_c0_g1_i1.p1  ORF type:complete len:147 (+),score=23.67 TRINITY_DN15739_c0_g1_i1:23-442(+)
MRFLIAVDRSESAKRAFKRAVSLYKEGDHIDILTITDLVHFYITSGSSLAFDELKTQMKNNAEALLKEYNEEAQKAGIQYTTHSVEGSARDVICEQVRDLKIDIVLLGQVGLTVTKSVSIGSTSDFVLRNAECDVLVVK